MHFLKNLFEWRPETVPGANGVVSRPPSGRCGGADGNEKLLLANGGVPL